MIPNEDSADRGLTMIELVIVIVLLGILAGAIGVIFANSWRAQNDVTSTTKATNVGQLVGQSVERAVRNGQALRVTGSGSTLWVRTAYTDTRQCQVFWVSGENKLYMATAATGASLGSPAPWATQVTQVDAATPYFTLSNADTIGYAFKLGTAAAPVTISGSVSLRTAPGVGGSCWS